MQGLAVAFRTGLWWSIFAGSNRLSLKVFFLTCVVVAGVFGAFTVRPINWKLLLLQGLIGGLALGIVRLARHVAGTSTPVQGDKTRVVERQDCCATGAVDTHPCLERDQVSDPVQSAGQRGGVTGSVPQVTACFADCARRSPGHARES
jgi:hypothetical protein